LREEELMENEMQCKEKTISLKDLKLIDETVFNLAIPALVDAIAIRCVGREFESPLPDL
jgi:hypothetical protein